MTRSIACVAAATAFGAAVAQSISLQTCDVKSSSSAFVIRTDGGVATVAGDSCLTFSSSTLIAAPCGSSPTAWNWHADGTVEAGATGQCWNANGGATSINTTIIQYACGSKASVAANDIFWFNAATQQILGNESGLCLSTAYIPPPPPPPPGTCTTELDCTLSGSCVNSKCVCYPPWTGALDCSVLEFTPSSPARGAAYPPPGHNETTWGGSVAFDAVGGAYHM